MPKDVLLMSWPKGKKRPSKAGEIKRKWTDIEWKVIRDHLDSGNRTKVKKLAEHLPGRSEPQIHNALNTERSRRRNTCLTCKITILPDKQYRSCKQCLQNKKEVRDDKAAKGLCQSCGLLIEDDGALTLCRSCSYKNRGYGYIYISKKRKKPGATRRKSTGPRYNLTRWKACYALPNILHNIPPGSRVIDLFGGSGSLTMVALDRGHDVIMWNDTHPLCKAHIECLLRGDQKDIKHHMEMCLTKTPVELQTAYETCLENPKIPLEQRAATFLVVARSTFGDVNNWAFHPDKKKWKVGRNWWANWRKAKAQLLTAPNLEICSEDFADIILRFRDREDVVFLIDPPFPNDTKFEHNINDRFNELVRLLLGVQGKFILCMHSSRPSVRVALQLPHVYWHQQGASFKELVCSNFELQEPGSLKLANLDKYAPNIG